MILRRIFFLVLAATLLLSLSPNCLAATTRRYYIAAENVPWDYAPSGKDLMHGRRVPLPWAKQTRWPKTRYIEYTDASFSVRKPQPMWLGILGPIIRAEVGDTVVVDFLNRTQDPHSMHPHGLRYDKANEGAHYLPAGAGASVAPGARYTYHWLADKQSGPGPGDPSSIVWWYHSHVDAEREINAGLLGPIIVTAAGKANPDGTPKHVDRELIAMFMIFDEKGPRPTNQHTDQDGLFYSINGYIFGNLPGLMMKQGEKVRWYLLAMGSEEDLHTPHWHGKVVTYGGRHTDVVELLPGSMATVDMNADNPGTWQFHCHVLEHMEAGMMAVYTIYPQPVPSSCPIEILQDDPEQDAEGSQLRVRNNTSKPIRRVNILAAYLVTYQDLEPLLIAWPSSPKTILPGQVGVVPLEKNMLRMSRGLGLVFFPSHVAFEDGTEWKPKQRWDCYQMYWREKDHYELPVLPPLQFSAMED